MRSVRPTLSRLRSVCRRLPFLVVLLSALAADCFSLAAEAVSRDLADAVPGHAPATYLDLMRLLVPDLAADGNGHSGYSLTAVRTLDADVQAAEPPQRITVSGVEFLDPGVAPGNRILLLAEPETASDSAEGYAVLALFDLSAVPRLLDAVNVAFDRFTAFAEQAALPVAGNAALVVTRSHHFNSSQNYATTVMSLVRGERIEPVDTFFTFDESGCGFERRQVPTFAAVTTSDAVPADFTVTVTETTRPAGDRCEDAPAPSALTRKIAVTYVWNGAGGRYEPSSDALLRLAAENAERF